MRIEEPQRQVGERKRFGDKSSFGLEFQIKKDASTSENLTRASMDRACCPFCSGGKPNLEAQGFLEASQGVRCGGDSSAHLLLPACPMDPLPLDLDTLLFTLGWHEHPQD